jgi:hypothetical protein
MAGKQNITNSHMTSQSTDRQQSPGSSARNEIAPTTQRTKAILRVLGGIGALALTALVYVVTGTKRGGKA